MGHSAGAPGGPRGERGQAVVLTALAMGLVLVGLCLGVIGAALEVSARAGLERAAEAAALGALQEAASVSLLLTVSYDDYACAAPAGGRPCAGTPGSATVTLGPGGGADAAEVGFGPVPGWAAAAGCNGTQWPGSAPPGLYRICTGQRVVGAQVSTGGQSALQAAAQWWLQANAATDGDLAAVQVVEVTAGAAGQITVSASATLRPHLPLFGRVAASATAWPGLPA